MKGTYIIPCKFSKEKNLLFNCLKSIRKHNPDHEIFVVDSDSEDKSYFSEIKKEFNVMVEDIANKNFTTGAIWHMYNNHPRPYYYILHDSTELYGNLDSYMKHDVVPVTISSPDIQWPVYPAKRYKQSAWNNANRSFVWAKEQLNNLTKFQFRESGFRCIGGCQILCNINVLHRLKEYDFDKVLPTNKYEEECTERLWGLALDELGYTESMLENAILKNRGHGGKDGGGIRVPVKVNGVKVRKNEYQEGDLIVKYWAGRR